MSNGSLTYIDYIKFFKSKKIISKNFNKNQVQPSSIDLTLSNECFQISSSFLSPSSSLQNKIQKFLIKKISLDYGYIFKKNKTYLVKLNESLNLPKSTFGKCNPKSSTGRLDIFCRTIFNYSNEYEKIPLGYKGDVFLEITSRAFDVKLHSGDSLNQMRLVIKKKKLINDLRLLSYHKKNPIIFYDSKKNIQSYISSGLKISVDLNNKNSIIAYKAKNNCPVLLFNKTKTHKISDFWKPIKCNNDSLTIFPGEFYILKSKEKIRIPGFLAAEMIPYDTAIGDFRAHYAGFFDPGFGSNKGSYAVLEVRTSEVPFTLEDGQIIATLIFEKLNKNPKISYGPEIDSNYQNQELALSKHFKVIE